MKPSSINFGTVEWGPTTRMPCHSCFGSTQCSALFSALFSASRSLASLAIHHLRNQERQATTSSAPLALQHSGGRLSGTSATKWFSQRHCRSSCCTKRTSFSSIRQRLFVKRKTSMPILVVPCRTLCSGTVSVRIRSQRTGESSHQNARLRDKTETSTRALSHSR